MFEKFLHQTPFFRLVIPLIVGIAFQINFPPHNFSGKFILLFLLILILSFQIFKLTRNFTLNKIWGIFISFFLFVLGVQLVKIKQEKEYIFQGNSQTCIATIIEQPEEKQNSIKTILKLDYLKASNQWKSNNSKVLCYFEKSPLSLNLDLGCQLIVNTRINEIKHTGNPYTFNYKRYLGYKEIYNHCYIKPQDFTVIAKNKGSLIRIISNKTRKKLINIYTRNEIQGEEFAVLSALTLGYKSELTPELKESFSASGAMHILAVSGLHVGIIYIILCKLLFFLQRNKYGKYLQSVIIITALFFYAFLTGLSDSVFRATIMFTFISIGNMFKRQVSIYNSIAASAFILLLINPYSIMNVGFQLSYAAVLSIVFFQPKLYSLLKINNTILDYTWQLVTVSIAAQIGTFPITMFYFGQFPLYFILTNILIIPLATIILYGSFALFLFSFSEIISLGISYVLNYVTLFLNRNILFIESLPNSKIDRFLIDGHESIFWVIVIVLISLFIISKRLRYLRLSFLLVLFIPIYNILFTHIKSRESLFVVHHMNNTPGISFIDKNKAQLFVDKESPENELNIKYVIEPLLKNMEIDKPNININHLDEPLNYLKFKGKRIVQVRHNSFKQHTTNIKLNLDYIILSNNANIPVQKLKDFFDFKIVIFDSSNSYYKVQNWQKECIENNIPFHNVLDKGAYIEYL